jgi:hypothetical protein
MILSVFPEFTASDYLLGILKNGTCYLSAEPSQEEWIGELELG